MPIEFKNADVAKKYTNDRTTDPRIHIPGKGNTGWAGRLSLITMEAADKLFATPKQNLIQLKVSSNSSEQE
jgi:hypothetical protein